MRHLAFGFTLVLSIAVTTMAEEKPARPKAEIPSAEKNKESEKLVKELFKAEYGKIDAASLRLLYLKLMQQAEENKADPAAEYVLLREARDVAVQAGDADMATAAYARFEAAFVVNYDLLLTEIGRVGASIRTPEPAAALAAVDLAVSRDATESERFDDASRFARHAETLIRNIKDPVLTATIKAEAARIDALKRESMAAAAAYKTLQANPDDANANLVMGKFAFLRGDFLSAIPFLAKGSDEGLKKLAQQELKVPEEMAERVTLADGWFERSEPEVPALKAKYQERAAHWYQIAVQNATGLAKLKIETRLKAMKDGAPDVQKVQEAAKVSKPAAGGPAALPAGLGKGLMMKKYMALKTQQGGNSKIDPSKFGPAVDSRVLESLQDGVGFDADSNCVASGFIKIEKAGEYSFKGTSWAAFTAYNINGKALSPRGENAPVKVDLPAGLIAIQVIGYVLPENKRFENFKARVQWQPPGEGSFVAVPEELLFHKLEKR